VLSVGLEALEALAVDEGGVGEAALWRRDRPASSLPWSFAMRWMVWPSGTGAA
jgi:hypothetical protein